MFSWFRKLFSGSPSPENTIVQHNEMAHQDEHAPAVATSAGEYQSRHAGWRDGKDDIDSLVEIIVDGMFHSPLETLLLKIDVFCEDRGMSEEEKREAVIASLDASAEKSMEDMVVTEHEESYFFDFLQHFNLSFEDLSPHSQKLLTQGKAIRAMLGGNPPSPPALNLPFLFQKSEQVVWAWEQIHLAEIVSKHKIVGRTRGISVRVLRGVYWRTGGFEGERVSRQELRPMGDALVAVTTKHIYYQLTGGTKRVRLDKIIGITLYSDSVLVSLDGATAKPLCFFTQEPAFLANVIQNAAHCAS